MRPRGTRQAVELHQRLVVEAHEVQIRWRQPRVFEAEGDGVGGKAVVVLLPGEALLLRRGDGVPVLDQRRRAVMVVR